MTDALHGVALVSSNHPPDQDDGYSGGSYAERRKDVVMHHHLEHLERVLRSEMVEICDRISNDLARIRNRVARLEEIPLDIWGGRSEGVLERAPRLKEQASPGYEARLAEKPWYDVPVATILTWGIVAGIILARFRFDIESAQVLEILQ